MHLFKYQRQSMNLLLRQNYFNIRRISRNFETVIIFA